VKCFFIHKKDTFKSLGNVIEIGYKSEVRKSADDSEHKRSTNNGTPIATLDEAIKLWDHELG